MTHTARVVTSLSIVIGHLLLSVPRATAGDLYVWTDESGQIRMTEDITQVPPAQRAHALQAGSQLLRRTTRPASEDVSEPTRRPTPKASAASPRATKTPIRGTGTRPGRKHVLQIERAGSEMRVNALVNGVVVPFVLDTGAQTCTLPRWAVNQMDVVIDADTPMVPVRGISGQTQWVPEIQVDSVAIDEVVVDGLQMTVLDSMDEGLLGMPFFNHFRVSMDPGEGTLVLEEIDLDAVDGVVGGLNESAWRQRFQTRRHALESVRKQLAKLPSEYITIRERLEAKEAYWERQLEQLDLEASRAGVPQDWRE